MSSIEERNIKERQEVIPLNLGLAYLKVGVITLVLGSIFVFIGLWIDRLYGKYPIFTIVLIAIAFPIILFINYKTIKKSIEKLCL